MILNVEACTRDYNLQRQEEVAYERTAHICQQVRNVLRTRKECYASVSYKAQVACMCATAAALPQIVQRMH